MQCWHAHRSRFARLGLASPSSEADGDVDLHPVLLPLVGLILIKGKLTDAGLLPTSEAAPPYFLSLAFYN
jgi:hypothetical protein